MALTPSFFAHTRATKAEVRAPAPAPASSNRTTLGSAPNIEAIKSATGAAVRNCPSSSCRVLGWAVAAAFIRSGYQTDAGFTNHQISPVLVALFSDLDIGANREGMELDGAWLCSPGDPIGGRKRQRGENRGKSIHETVATRWRDFRSLAGETTLPLALGARSPWMVKPAEIRRLRDS